MIEEKRRGEVLTNSKRDKIFMSCEFSMKENFVQKKTIDLEMKDFKMSMTC
jgi:hypothetical protein